MPTVQAYQSDGEGGNKHNIFIFLLRRNPVVSLSVYRIASIEHRRRLQVQKSITPAWDSRPHDGNYGKDEEADQ